MLKTAHHANGTTRQVHLGGWKKQSTDARDEAYRLKLPTGFLKLASAVDNRNTCSPIEDQQDIGSCTAHMFAGLVEANEIKRQQGLHSTIMPLTASTAQAAISNISVSASGVITFTTTVTPGTPAPAPTPPPAPTPAPTPAPVPAKLERASRLFEYYATRKIEGTTSEDSGATIRDAIKAGALYGVADEAAYPYNTAVFTANPPQAIWTAAAAHKVTSYHSITDGDITTMKATLAGGSLIGYGFQVYDYFMSQSMASKGFLPVPAASEQLQGGHAVCLVGYDDNMVNPFNSASKGAFLVRNSWGLGWGWQGSGYFWCSYDYIKNTSLCSDFWVVVSAPI
jgi:hypothetical protein